MGSEAYFIPVEVDDSLVQPKPIKKNIIDKFLFRQRYSEPIYTDFGDKILIEILSNELDQLGLKFISFLKETIEEPIESSQRIFDYLDSDILTIYSRGEMNKLTEKKKWYIQMTFSGCAGMAGVSALLCSHWAEVWFQNKKKDIVDTILSPAGFTPIHDLNAETVSPFFFPTTNYGYAFYDKHADDGCHFEIDIAYIDEEDEREETLKELENTYCDKITSSKCECQLCIVLN